MGQGGFGGGFGQPPGGGGWGPPPGGGWGGGAPPPGGGWGGGAPPPGGGWGGGAPPPGGGWGSPPGWGPPGPPGFAPPPQGYPPGYAPPHGGPPGNWSPTDAISFAWERIKADPGTILGALIVAGLIAGSLSVIGGFVAQAYAFAGAYHRHRSAFPWDPTYLGIRGGFQLVSYVVQTYMMGGMVSFSLKVARGEPYTFTDVFNGAPWFVPLLAANLLMGIAVSFGLLFLIVPGVYIALAWSLASPLIVDRNLGVLEAMGQSWKLTEGHKANIFVFGLLAACLFVVGMCACGIGVLVAAAVIELAWVWIYLRITGQPTVA